MVNTGPQEAKQGRLVEAVLRGEVRATARACRIVDEGWPGHLELLAALYPHGHKSWCIGVTGSPGVGKSTLTSRLVQHVRSEGKRVAVVAVDPTSPFSGGALLGDRIRMQAHWADPNVFIRSVATRGAVGGLSRTAGDVVRVLGAWGAEVVLLETVGVGQDELDVVRVAHSTLVVQAPGFGDDLQAAKAGLLECADVFAVNKADLAGAEGAVQDLRSMLALGQVTGAARAADWEVPVVACVAARDEGVQAVLDDLKRHYRWLHDTPAGQARRSARLRDELTMLIREALSAMVLERHRSEIEQAALQVAANEIDPYSASRQLISRWQI